MFNVGKTSKKKKKADSAEGEEKVLDVGKAKGDIVSNTDYMNSHLFNEIIKLSPTSLVPPGKDIRARPLNSGHVAKLMKSFALTSSSKKYFEVVIRSNALLPQTTNISRGKCAKEIIEGPYTREVIAGNHSLHAVLLLGRQDPTDKTWWEVECRVYITEENEEDRKNLYMYGTLDNVRGSLSALLEFADCVRTLREQIMNAPEKAKDEVTETLVVQYAYQRQLEFATVKGYVNIALLPEEVWVLVDKLLSVQKRNAQKPYIGSPYMLQMTSGMTDEQKIEAYQILLSNTKGKKMMTGSGFQLVCHHIRDRAEILEEIAGEIQEEDRLFALISDLSWSTIKENFPLLSDEDWISGLLSQMFATNHLVTSDIRLLIKAMVAKEINLRQGVQEVPFHSYISRFLSLVHSSIHD